MSDFKQIQSLLGDKAASLLEHQSKTISKDQLHLPSPIFIDDNWALSDRSPRVLRSLQSLHSTGRLADTGYLSILPVDQGIEHSAGASFAKNPIYFEHEGNRALRRGKWKLVMKHKGPWELYDIDADRTEQHDVIAEQPELAKELIADWEAWAKRADVGPWPGRAREAWGDEKPEKQKKAAQAAGA